MGWIGTVILLVGVIQVGRKKRSAFLWTAAGEAVWTYEGCCRDQFDLAVLCALFGALAVWNWFYWGAEDGPG